jgi:hypothetical protein
MIISDLEHLEVVHEEKSLEGGYARADAYAYASASGRNIAISRSTTYSGTISSYSYISGYYPGSYPPYGPY